MLESEAIERIRVESDPTEPDWRFRLLVGDAVVAEGFFDADTGWDVGDRPRGWTVRHMEDGVPAEFCREEAIRPGGKLLTWGARDAAAAAATEIVAAARRTGAPARVTPFEVPWRPNEGERETASGMIVSARGPGRAMVGAARHV
ncbi:MAG TPA: hypothetical protein VIJ51_13170 [Solirubrobacteraceae bacterium]